MTALFKALADAQRDLRAPKFDSQSTAFGSRLYRYASLASVTAAARSALAAHGISILQPVKTVEGKLAVETILVHASGEMWSAGLLIVPVGAKLQDFGSAITYARRYQLCAALAIVADDDVDAEEPKRAEPSSDELRERLESIKRRHAVESALAGKKKPEIIAVEGVVERTEERQLKDGMALMILLETGDKLWVRGPGYSGITPGSRYRFTVEKTTRGMVVVDAQEVGDAA